MLGNRAQNGYEELKCQYVRQKAVISGAVKAHLKLKSKQYRLHEQPMQVGINQKNVVDKDIAMAKMTKRKPKKRSR